MRVCVLLNPNAGTADAADALRDTPGVEIREASGPVDTEKQAAQAAREGFDVVAAAGGDGTVHAVANGLIDALGEGATDGPAFAVLPLGTGNDFARTLALPLDAAEALALVETGERRALDLIRVTDEDTERGRSMRYAVNVCAGGFSGQVDEILTDEMKQSWGPLAYLLSTAKALPNIDDYETHLAWGDGPNEAFDAFNVVVANGRTAAGGKPAAPRANPEDGLLDVVVVRRITGLQLAGLAARVLVGDYLESEHVLYRRVNKLRVTSRPGMWFNVDGELHTKQPVTFEAVPGALRTIVGPDYRAEPDS